MPGPQLWSRSIELGAGARGGGLGLGDLREPSVRENGGGAANGSPGSTRGTKTLHEHTSHSPERLTAVANQGIVEVVSVRQLVGLSCEQVTLSEL